MNRPAPNNHIKAKTVIAPATMSTGGYWRWRELGSVSERIGSVQGSGGTSGSSRGWSLRLPQEARRGALRRCIDESARLGGPRHTSEALRWVQRLRRGRAA